MSLWNNIKDWFDDNKKPESKEIQVEAKKEVVETKSVDKAQIERLFFKVCIEAKIPKRVFRNASVPFLEWYSGDADEKLIQESICEFLKSNPDVKLPWKGC